MFGYIDPTIREQLIEKGQLIRINGKGEQIGVDDQDADSDVTLNVLGPIPLPVDIGDKRKTVNWFAFVRHTELAVAEEIADSVRKVGDRRLLPLLSTHMAVNSALIHGDLRGDAKPLVRVHSCCMTGDVFGSKRCECGPQFEHALDRITQAECGALIYMSGHEGRGIGLWGKAITYLLQDSGQDTYQANESLGLPADSRDFTDAAAMLLYLLGGNRPFTLLSNNPKKHTDLRARGLTNFEPEKHVAGVSEYNRRYLNAKRAWGHILEADDIVSESEE